jgi:transcriptional regulator with XRE-family HTH domain
MDTIGSRLKAYAKARCGSVKRLAEELGMRPDNLQKYASGKNEPGAKLLQQLAAHGCNVHWLIMGDGVMFVEEMTPNETSGKERDMLALLKTIGIKDTETLKTLLNDLKLILDVQDSLKSKLGDLITEPVLRKREKSGA